MPPHWQMASYFFKSLQAHEHENLHELIQATLEENWSDAMWVFSRDFAGYFKADDTKSVLLSMRKLANIAGDKSAIILRYCHPSSKISGKTCIACVPTILSNRNCCPNWKRRKFNWPTSSKPGPSWRKKKPWAKNCLTHAKFWRNWLPWD